MERTEQIVVDLSGKAGLSSLAGGNIDQVTNIPNEVLDNGTGEMASGLFNAFVKDGMLSPAIQTSEALTFPSGQPFLASVVHDSLSGQTYFAERLRSAGGQRIFTLDNLTSTAFEEVTTLVDASSVSDLELYSINNERKLFYIWETKSAYVNTAVNGSLRDWLSYAITLKPSGTNTPRVIASAFNDRGSSKTINIDVPAGANKTVVVALSAASAITVSALTFNSTAMTFVGTHTRSNGTGQTSVVYYRLNTSASGNIPVELTGSASGVINMTVVVLTGVDQTTPIEEQSRSIGTGSNAENLINLQGDNRLVLNYTTGGSTALQLSGTTTGPTFDEGTQTGNTGRAIFFRPNGTTMYVMSGAGNIFQYTLSTAWAVNTASYASLTTAATAGAFDFHISNDGVFLYTINFGSPFAIRRFTMSTPWNISTAGSAVTVNANTITVGLTALRGLTISADGKKMYVTVGTDSIDPQEIREFEFGTPFDLTTLTDTGRGKDFGIGFVDGIRLALNDTCLIVNTFPGSNNVIRRLDFSSLKPGNINSASVSSDSFSVGAPHRMGYIIDGGFRMFLRSDTNNDVLQYNLSSSFGGTSFSSSDTTISSNGSGNFLRYVFTSTNTTSKVVDVGIMSIPTPGLINSNWLTDTQGLVFGSRSDYNFMRTADNGFAYLFTGNTIARIDGETTGGPNGSVVRDVLVFPSFFTIKDAVDYRSKMYICIQQNPGPTENTNLNNYVGTVGIYAWDRLSTQLSRSDYIELPGVREIKKIYVSADQVLKLIVIANDGTTELREFGYNDSGGVVYRLQKKLGIGAYPQFPDGVTNAGEKTLWLANNGTVYAEYLNSVTKVHEVKSPATTVVAASNNIKSGALFYGSGVFTAGAGEREIKNRFVYSLIDGSIPSTRSAILFNSTGRTNNSLFPNRGDVYTTVRAIPQHSTVRRVRIYNLPTVDETLTDIATVKIYFNQSTSPDMVKTVSGKEAKRGYQDFGINKSYINTIQIEVEWNTAIPIGPNTYRPSAAVISYVATRGTSPDNE